MLNIIKMLSNKNQLHACTGIEQPAKVTSLLTKFMRKYL